MTLPESVVLPLHCAFCHGAVEVLCDPGLDSGTLVPVWYRCPYCQEINSFNAPGAIQSATKRDEDAPSRR